MNQLSSDVLAMQPEGQTFDRKSVKIAVKDLAVIVVAFANADGGTLPSELRMMANWMELTAIRNT